MSRSLKILKSALDCIVKSLRFSTLENGGAIIGVPSREPVILNAGEAGRNSIKALTSFTTDPEADKACLEKSRLKYGPEIEILGYYHKHFYMPLPSSKDIRQAIKLKEHYGDGKDVIMCIYSNNGTLSDTEKKLRFFTLDYNNLPTEYQWHIIDDDSPEIDKAIKSVPARPPIVPMQYWKDENFLFYLNPIGRARIETEIKMLKERGYLIKTMRDKSKPYMIMEVTIEQVKLNFLLPPEYPLNPPIVTTTQLRLSGLDIIKGWNSIFYLTDVITEALQR